MGWRSVIITQHAKLSYSARALIVQTRDGINQIPIEDIDLVLIETTQAVITAALVSQLAENQVKVLFTNGSGQPICETVGYYPNNRTRELILKQCHWDNARIKTIWTKIVESKIKLQIAVLKMQDEDVTPIAAVLDQLEIDDPTNQEAVAARKYFPILFADKFSRRDGSAINAALNYGYAILLSCIDREIAANGYLTFIGIHHHSNENQFNLGSDLMEPFRPIVDWWVVNQKFNELTPDIKYGLVRLLNLEISFNGKHMLLRNALTEHVRNCLAYLSQSKDALEIEMGFLDEVSNHAINDHV
ncbi:type II CRISPR-associated endonuclease Cas1 [Agrilactobacillus fermenti]|uniref:type II CRISPR-associated endonuclease Cas1 n=1 Tax=Agrilactobacillus fermenti TaxID=2586909 RepID=UPI003A5C7210